jgi:hypothetical protein
MEPKMPVLTDEVVLDIDGFLFVDPRSGLRQRAESFLASRPWSTSQIFYGDQPELEDGVAQQPAWSMNFGLGLDRIKTTHEDWFSDVIALLNFVQTLQREIDNEFVAEVRYRSKLWYSEHITFIDNQELDFPAIRAMIVRVI